MKDLYLTNFYLVPTLRAHESDNRTLLRVFKMSAKSVQVKVGVNFKGLLEVLP